MTDDTRVAHLLSTIFQPGAVLFPSRPATADDETCPKCGWRGPGAEGWKVYYYCSPEDAEKARVVNGECLVVACGRCKFRWSEPARKPGC